MRLSWKTDSAIIKEVVSAWATENQLVFAQVQTEEKSNEITAIPALLEQMDRGGQELPREIVYDRGGKGRGEIMGVKILIPDRPKKADSGYMKQEKRKRFRSRAGIEAVIGHLKSDFRMAQNYLGGEAGIQINAFMSCAAWNLKKLMAALNEQAARLFVRLFARPILLDFWGIPAK